jgi:hypothetical protein
MGDVPAEEGAWKSAAGDTEVDALLAKVRGNPPP